MGDLQRWLVLVALSGLEGARFPEQMPISAIAFGDTAGRQKIQHHRMNPSIRRDSLLSFSILLALIFSFVFLCKGCDDSERKADGKLRYMAFL